MKRSFYILPVFLLLALTVNAQAPVKALRADTIRKIKTSSISVEITKGLQRIINLYANVPCDETTWSAIKKEAADYLYSYYKNGLLKGIKPEQAYYVLIGLQTMTQNDIANNHKILVAGVALVKPAEFTEIKVETIAGASK